MGSLFIYAWTIATFVFASLLSIILCNINDVNYEDRSPVEVRAVFIDCELAEKKDESFESENTRFQREELFKHNNLRDCRKKIALTVKMINQPGKISGDEYIPIEHVIDGPRKKRVRLLNPFVLRLRREQPLQAYKIRRIDTVNGILINTDEGNMVRSNDKKGQLLHKSLRLKRIAERKNNNYYACPITDNCDEKTANITLFLHERNSISQEDTSTGQERLKRQSEISPVDNYFSPWSKNEYQPYVQDREVRNIFNKIQQPKLSNGNKKGMYNYNGKYVTKHDTSSQNRKLHSDEKFNSQFFNPYDDKKIKNNKVISKKSAEKYNEKFYAVYEIGKPNLWYTVNIQLYEKLSTPEMKIVWNDITKEEIARVGTLHPEWNNEDMSIRYRSGDQRREEFFLSKSSLCLLIPIHGAQTNILEKDSDVVIDKLGEFLVVAIEDIIPKYEENRNSSTSPVANVSKSEFPRPVLVRTSRAVMGGSTENLMFASSGSEQYLMIPHQHIHRSQIDVESRADDNQLIHVGSSGRIIIGVSDTTRKTRTVLTLEVSNTGLAAARFRVAARDCFMGSPGRGNNDGAKQPVTSPVLLPPKHTHRFQLEISFEFSDDVTHCSVKLPQDNGILAHWWKNLTSSEQHVRLPSFNRNNQLHNVQLNNYVATLINDDGESVAVRDVTMKRDDRCFCVWHCDCVCLSDDPKLLCREMSDTKQIAAGLTLRKVARRTRSVCYPDNVTLDIVVIVLGVLAALLTLGFIKAVIGLFLQCVASWGLDRLLMMPRKLDHYYESCLRYRPVVYDEEGWPIHPDTKKRTVRYISKPMEFTLNLIFFVTIPCVILCDTFKLLSSKCVSSSRSTVEFKSTPDVKRAYHAEDIQVPDRSPDGRCRTMRGRSKSQADELSAVIWQKGLSVQKATDFNYLRSLLRDECCRKSDDLLSYADSEQDDTNYVLMQMQKSRESLARSQRKQTEKMDKNRWKDDVMPSTSKR